jgi:hypothetical protein
MKPVAPWNTAELFNLAREVAVAVAFCQPFV